MNKKNEQKKSDYRLPPHSGEAEQGSLGCALLAPAECLNEFEERGVTIGWYYEIRHQMLLTCLQKMHKEGLPVDLITLQTELKKAGNLEEIGGIAYLATLQDTTPTASHLEQYLDILHEQFLRRKIIQIGTVAVERAFETNVTDTVEDLLHQAETEILMLSEERTSASEVLVKTVVPSVLDTLEDYHRGQAQITGLSSGLEYLDKITGGFGGEDKGNYIVISARPGTGKTSLATFIALNAAQKKVPVGIFSMEMAKKPLTMKMVFQLAGADMQKWRTGYATAGDFEHIAKAAATLNKAPIYIDDTRRRSIDSLKASARRMHRQHGIKLFIVDYIQLMSNGGRRYQNDRVQEMSQISGELQALSGELNVPFFILAQMNREYEKEPNRAPRLSDLKDCGSIEQDADLVLFLYKKFDGKQEEENYNEAMAKVYGEDDWSKHPKFIKALIAKNRFGPSDKKVNLLFHGNCGRFEDYTEFLKKHGFKNYAAGETPESKRGDDDDKLPSSEEMNL